MRPPVAAFLDAASVAVDLLGRSELAGAWDRPSVCAELSVGGLAGHLLRGIATVEIYLAEPEPEGEAISASDYFHRLALSDDVNDPLNLSIRRRAEEAAQGGPESVARHSRNVFERLSSALPDEDAGRRLKVAGGLVLTLDSYLQTRVVELVVHVDDVACSLSLESPNFHVDTTTAAIEVLIGVARLRHGDIAVLRALARRERDGAGALRVF